MAAPQRPVWVLPQTRRRGPAITIFYVLILKWVYNLLLYQKLNLFIHICFRLDFYFRKPFNKHKECTCCPDVLHEALPLVSKEILPTMVVLRLFSPLFSVKVPSLLFAHPLTYEFLKDNSSPIHRLADGGRHNPCPSYCGLGAWLPF